MILTCPQCTTRYLLPATVLAPDGRNVKCSSCSGVWFEEPDYDELAELQAADEDDSAPPPEFDDIPDGVKPDIELDFVDREDEQAEEESRDTIDLKAYIVSYAAAASVFFLVLGFLVTVKSPMVNAWPASAGLYQMLGMRIAVPGEGLVFDRLAIESSGESESGEDFVISGQVINLTSDDQLLPFIEANLRKRNGETLETWYVDVPEKNVPAEADLKFTQNYSANALEAHELFLRFAFKKKKGAKIASKDGDNTHAQSSDDHAPLSGGEEGLKSHAHDSAPHH